MAIVGGVGVFVENKKILFLDYCVYYQLRTTNAEISSPDNYRDRFITPERLEDKNQA
jgi:hypothetical protein